jgi:aromatic ring hydroxylase
VQPIRADLKIPRWLMERIGQRAAATSGALQVVLASAALTDILLRLLDRSRASRRTRKTDIQERLREFELAWEQSTGERLSTAAFYDRFCAGDSDFDTRFGARWATYYEATLARSEPRDGLSHLGLRRPSRG